MTRSATNRSEKSVALEPAKRHGFTLIELLVVIAIIGILIGLLLPAVQKVREAANRTRCENNLKQIGLAMHNFHGVYNTLPPTRIAYTAADGWASWLVLLWPYVEQDGLYRQWDLPSPYAKQNATVQQAVVKTYRCPSRVRPSDLSVLNNGYDGLNIGAVADYAASCGDRTSYGGLLDDKTANGAITESKWTLAANKVTTWNSLTSFPLIIDGTSNTLLVGEKEVLKTRYGQDWVDSSAYNGRNVPRNIGRCGGPGFPIADSATAPQADNGERTFGSSHPGCCNFVFCDGSVRALAVSISPTTLRLLVVRNDGQPLPPDY